MTLKNGEYQVFTTLAATLHVRRKSGSHTFEGSQERKCEPRTVNPAKLTFMDKGHRDARIQRMLFPWALSETSVSGWASDNRNEQREVNVRTGGITHSYLHEWDWITGGHGRGHMVAECTEYEQIQRTYVLHLGRKGRTYANIYIYTLFNCFSNSSLV